MTLCGHQSESSYNSIEEEAEVREGGETLNATYNSNKTNIGHNINIRPSRLPSARAELSIDKDKHKFPH